MLNRCLRCQGSKKIAPMGGIYVTCTTCNGLGYIKPASPELSSAIASKIENDTNQEIDQNSTSDIAANELIKKRPGRKAGWNKQQTERTVIL